MAGITLGFLLAVLLMIMFLVATVTATKEEEQQNKRTSRSRSKDSHRGQWHFQILSQYFLAFSVVLVWIVI